MIKNPAIPDYDTKYYHDMFTRAISKINTNGSYSKNINAMINMYLELYLTDIDGFNEFNLSTFLFDYLHSYLKTPIDNILTEYKIYNYWKDNPIKIYIPTTYNPLVG